MQLYILNNSCVFTSTFDYVRDKFGLSWENRVSRKDTGTKNSNFTGNTSYVLQQAITSVVQEKITP